MQLDLDTLRTDLRAAARLGLPEGLDMALAPLGTWQAFSSNARLEPEAVRRVLVPLGEELAAPAVSQPYLLALAEHPLAGGRALAAAALAVRWLRGQDAAAKPLSALAADRRAEVRLALVETLRQRGKRSPERLEALLSRWLDCRRSPRLLVTALTGLEALLPRQAARAWRLASRCRGAQPEEVQRALGDALQHIAAGGAAEAVLNGLAEWAAAAPTPEKAILRALRGGWALAYRQQALQVLDALEARYGTSRPVRRARRALGK